MSAETLTLLRSLDLVDYPQGSTCCIKAHPCHGGISRHACIGLGAFTRKRGGLSVSEG
jgi:hypothetical protein